MLTTKDLAARGAGKGSAMEEIKIIRVTRACCVGNGIDAEPGDIQQVPASTAGMLVGYGLAEWSNEKELAAQLEKRTGASVATRDPRAKSRDPQ